MQCGSIEFTPLEGIVLRDNCQGILGSERYLEEYKKVGRGNLRYSFITAFTVYIVEVTLRELCGVKKSYACIKKVV